MYCVYYIYLNTYIVSPSHYQTITACLGQIYLLIGAGMAQGLDNPAGSSLVDAYLYQILDSINMSNDLPNIYIYIYMFRYGLNPATDQNIYVYTYLLPPGIPHDADLWNSTCRRPLSTLNASLYLLIHRSLPAILLYC